MPAPSVRGNVNSLSQSTGIHSRSASVQGHHRPPPSKLHSRNQSLHYGAARPVSSAECHPIAEYEATQRKGTNAVSLPLNRFENISFRKHRPSPSLQPRHVSNSTSSVSSKSRSASNQSQASSSSTSLETQRPSLRPYRERPMIREPRPAQPLPKPRRSMSPPKALSCGLPHVVKCPARQVSLASAFSGLTLEERNREVAGVNGSESMHKGAVKLVQLRRQPPQSSIPILTPQKPQPQLRPGHPSTPSSTRPSQCSPSPFRSQSRVSKHKSSSSRLNSRKHLQSPSPRKVSAFLRPDSNLKSFSPAEWDLNRKIEDFDNMLMKINSMKDQMESSAQAQDATKEIIELQKGRSKFCS